MKIYANMRKIYVFTLLIQLQTSVKKFSNYVKNLVSKRGVL